MTERSKFQEGVVSRYFQHFDTISIQKLSEIVSEIYLAEANKPVKLWERAKNLLSRVAQDDPRVAEIVAKKDIKALARLVNELNIGMKSKKSQNDNPVTEDLASSFAEGDKAMVVASPKDTVETDSASATAIPNPDSDDPLSADNLKRAMKAFRKRMKLTRLDDESKLGRVGNPMSGGKKSQVAAIMAPREFPKTVWLELVKQGKLKTNDGVFFELAEGV